VLIAAFRLCALRNAPLMNHRIPVIEGIELNFEKVA
jgi:hypothetical protein